MTPIILETERLIVRQWRLDDVEIYGVVLPANSASRRALEKIGMRNLGMGDYGGVPVEVLVIDAQH